MNQKKLNRILADKSHNVPYWPQSGRNEADTSFRNWIITFYFDPNRKTTKSSSFHIDEILYASNGIFFWSPSVFDAHVPFLYRFRRLVLLVHLLKTVGLKGFKLSALNLLFQKRVQFAKILIVTDFLATN